VAGLWAILQTIDDYMIETQAIEGPGAVSLSAPAIGSHESAGRLSRVRRSMKLLVYSVSIIVWLALLVDGYSYYTTPYLERPHHEDYRALRPAGSRGLLFGIIGASMMVLMLGYTLRKRFRGLSRWGALPYWLDVHIYFGAIGPLCIVLHTSFKVQGLVAIAFWSMVCVAVSGVLGRYLYSQIPRNLRGDQMSLEEVRRSRDQLRSVLRDEFGLSEPAVAHLERAHVSGPGDGVWRALGRVLIEDAKRIFHRPSTTRADLGSGRSHAQIARMNEAVRQMTLLDRRIQVWHHMQRLFHYWHVFHKPFAIVMYVVMGIHIVVAVWTGYGWMS
jgi:hypothetical protein